MIKMTDFVMCFLSQSEKKKRNDVLTHVTAGMTLEKVILSERNQSQRQHIV